jgi:hypothetical protein
MRSARCCPTGCRGFEERPDEPRVLAAGGLPWVTRKCRCRPDGNRLDRAVSRAEGKSRRRSVGRPAHYAGRRYARGGRSGGATRSGCR